MNQLQLPKWRKHMPVTIFGAAAIAMAVGGLVEPAVAQAVWDVGAYDSCAWAVELRFVAGKTNAATLADEYRFCCERSGGEWSQNKGPRRLPPRRSNRRRGALSGCPAPFTPGRTKAPHGPDGDGVAEPLHGQIGARHRATADSRRRWDLAGPQRHWVPTGLMLHKIDDPRPVSTRAKAMPIRPGYNQQPMVRVSPSRCGRRRSRSGRRGRGPTSADHCSTRPSCAAGPEPRTLLAT
jgi:hypothetical protein